MNFFLSQSVSIFARPLFVILGTACLIVISTACSKDASVQGSSNLNADASEINGQERGGGDIQTIQDQVLTSQLERLSKQVRRAFEDESSVSVRSMTLAFLSRANRMPAGTSREILADMVKKGAIEDLQKKVRFRMSADRESECIDSFDGKARSATATMNPSSDDPFVVCVDPLRIAKERGPLIPDAELIGLTVHEIAHFYGYRDQDHSLAASVSQFLFSEASKIDDESLFHLVPNEMALSQTEPTTTAGWPTARSAKEICDDPKNPKFRDLAIHFDGQTIRSEVWTYFMHQGERAKMPCYQEPVEIMNVTVDGSLANVVLGIDGSKRVPSIYLDPAFFKMASYSPYNYSSSQDYNALVKRSLAKGVAISEIQASARGALTAKLSFNVRGDEKNLVASTWSTHASNSESVFYVQLTGATDDSRASLGETAICLK